jgi:diacylglycerol kinase family enzyme
LNEALNGMPGCDVPLGILPGGTANVLAMELGIGSRMRSVAARLGEFVPCPVSAGLLRCREIPKGRHFLLMAGAGLDAAIVQKVSLPLKAATGKFAYWVAGLCKLPELVTPLSVRSESGARRCGFALVSRVRNYGGDLSIARSVSLTDDDFEVVLFEGRVPLRYGVYFAALLAGVHARLPGVTVFRSRKLELEPAGAKEVHIQIDGELAGSLPATVEIVPQAIQLLVPPSYLVNRAESPWTTSHTHSRA